ncbi:MAG: hypothetical protein HY516_02240 [Candidatus Aenigmarchaeota archaeon]|nr:hypothetical protein [Candidatus Aenigmarchaeota archaeon]
MTGMKICGHCGIEYADSRSTCSRCGNSLRNTDPHAPIAMGSGGAVERHANYKSW